jgi:hypothetical protein
MDECFSDSNPKPASTNNDVLFDLSTKPSGHVCVICGNKPATISIPCVNVDKKVLSEYTQRHYHICSRYLYCCDECSPSQTTVGFFCRVCNFYECDPCLSRSHLNPNFLLRCTLCDLTSCVNCTDNDEAVLASRVRFHHQAFYFCAKCREIPSVAAQVEEWKIKPKPPKPQVPQ